MSNALRKLYKGDEKAMKENVNWQCGQRSAKNGIHTTVLYI